MTEPEAWDTAIEHMIDNFGSIDTLINNAGILISGVLPTTDLDKQLSLVDINCKGVLIGCHKLAPYLADAKTVKLLTYPPPLLSMVSLKLRLILPVSSLYVV